MYDKNDLIIKISKDATNLQIEEIKQLTMAMPTNDVLAGLRFAHKRWTAKDAGELKVGRKSLIRKEVHSVTAEQARWRLANWKEMIAEYRRKGYSYPSISRIKKLLAEKAADTNDDTSAKK